MQTNGSAKGSLGVVFETAKRVLGNTEGLGENASQFSADVLAPLVGPDMQVRRELLDETGLIEALASPG